MERTVSSLKSNNVCRLCLSTRGETQPIFSSGSSSGESASPVLASKIEECVSVKINESDGLPAQICTKCLSNVNNWHVFKKVCNDAQLKLRDWVNSETSSAQGINIKKEPFPEELVDDEIMIDASYGTELDSQGAEKFQPEGPPILASLGLAPRNEKSNIDPRADWDRIVAIQSLIEQDEALEGSDCEEEDHLDISEVDTDSDQELSSHRNDLSPATEYISKDTYTTWSARPSKQIKDSLKRKFISGPSIPTDGAQTPLQAWSSLITDSILTVIVDSTNEYIQEHHPSVGVIGEMNDNRTNRSEIMALFGILYLSGIMRPAFHRSSELWWGDGCGLAIIQIAMTMDRFKFLLRCLKFGGDLSSESDKLSPVRQILEEFSSNSKQSYNLGECAVVDESIVTFNGNCPFRKSLQSKKYVKNGLKIYSLVDPETFYTHNIEVCVDRKDTNENYRLNTVSNKISGLVSHLSGTGTTIVTRSRLTSVKLAKRLADEYGLHLVGSLQSKRNEVPTLFYDKKNKNHSSYFGFNQETTLLSYLQAKRKACLVLSTRSDHYNTKKYSKSGAPEAVVWYKQRRGAAAVASTLAASYTCSKRCTRWPLALFFHILDVAILNAQVLWMASRNQTDVVFRRNFIRSLALELINEQVRSNNLEERSSLELDPLLAIRGGPKNGTSADALLGRHRRCKLCPRNADRKTRFYCIACNVPACKEHYKPICICCALKY